MKKQYKTNIYGMRYELFDMFQDLSESDKTNLVGKGFSISASIDLDCPICGNRNSFSVIPQRPDGGSHRETHVCKKCNNKHVLIVYYDGDVVIQGY